MSDFEQFLKPGKRGHLIGAGGVSMAPLAEVLAGMGLVIDGSDMAESEKTRYLRSLGMPLSDIQEILTEGTVDTMQKLLEKQRLRVEEERRRINEMYEDIVWYQSYFSYLQQYDFDKVPYLVKLDKRCILAVDYRSEDDVEAVETRLAALKNSEGLNKMQYRRQFGYLADYDALFEGAFEPKKYFVYVKEQLFDHPNIVELPAGVYLCFRSRICAGEWDSGIL